MFNRSEVMKSAWAMRNAHYASRPWIVRKFDRAEFGFYLATAWRNAREAQMTAKEVRAASITREIDNLKFATLRIDVDGKRQRLSAQFAAITA